MKGSHLTLAVAAGIVAYGYYSLVAQRGELDIPSYALAKITKAIMIQPYYPKKDLSDLALWRTLVNLFALPNNLFHRVSSVVSEDIEINTYLDANYAPVIVRVYKSKTASSDPKPVILWFHGGGFVVGSANADDAMCTEMVVGADAIVVNVEYRMAPEHPFPTPINDCISALQWTSKHIASFGGDPKKLFVAGESAGGNIATVLTAYNLDTQFVAVKDRVGIVGSFLIYPAVDIDGQYPSHDTYADFCGILTKSQLDRFKELYCSADVRTKCRENYLFSPVRAPDAVLSQFPATTVMLAKYDVLFDEGVAMAEKLKKLGVDTELIVYNSTVHFFFGKHMFPHGASALKTLCEKVRAIAASVN